MNDLNCYICHKSTFIAIPEEQGAKNLVPCCRKCYHQYSSGTPFHFNEAKAKMKQEILEDISYELEDIRSELTCTNSDKEWCINKICDLLGELNNEE